MSDDALKTLMKEAEALSVDDQLRLASHLIERVRNAQSSPAPRRKWSEIRGMAHLPPGLDAQEWVSRIRRESDEARGL